VQPVKLIIYYYFRKYFLGPKNVGKKNGYMMKLFQCTCTSSG